MLDHVGPSERTFHATPPPLHTETKRAKGVVSRTSLSRGQSLSLRLTRDRDVRARKLSYKVAAASLFRCSNGAEEKAL